MSGFEEDGSQYVTHEVAKGIKQYERLKTAFMEDNNVLVHFGSYGLIFGIPQSETLTFTNLIQYLNLCFAFYKHDGPGLRQFEGRLGLVSIKYRQAYQHAYTIKIRTGKDNGEDAVPAGIWNIVEDNGDLIPFHAVRFLDRFIVGKEACFIVPTSRQPKDDAADTCSNQTVTVVQSTTNLGTEDAIKSEQSVSDVAKSSFSLLPSRDSGICNALRARNGDFYGRGLQYINPKLEYTQLWDAEAKRYVSNWNRKHNERIKSLLRANFPGNEAYPPRLSSIHSPLNAVSATVWVGVAFSFPAISVNPFDKHKIVSFIPIKEGPKSFAEEDIQPFLTLEGIEPQDRPDQAVLLEHLQYSLLLRCVWQNANELYLPTSEVITRPEAFRRTIYEQDESPSKELNMDTLLPDGCDPCDEDFQLMVMD